MCVTGAKFHLETESVVHTSVLSHQMGKEAKVFLLTCIYHNLSHTTETINSLALVTYPLNG